MIPRQAPAAVTGTRGAAGDTLVRDPPPRLDETVADVALFLAGRSGARINGQTLLLS